LPTSDEFTKRVFITATYNLAEVRRLVADAVRHTGNVAVTIEPWEPPNLIGRTLLNSDLLLMIIGPRYGSPAFGNLSFPEYEYRLAQRAGIPVAAVLLPNVGQAEDRQSWFLRHFNPQFVIEAPQSFEELPRTVEAFIREIAPQVRHGVLRDERAGILHVVGMAPVATADVAAYLSHLEHAYNSIVTFSGIITDAFIGLRSELPHRLIILKQSSSLIAPSERLLLYRASLASPGSWEFIGKLNPLEVIRQYLNDRHERRKDLEYREAEERKRLGLENELLKNKVISERLQLARDLGVPERDLIFAANRLLFEPLRQLDSSQDQGVIQNAEIIEPPLTTGGEESPDR
jgi:hypothetical protein